MTPLRQRLMTPDNAVPDRPIDLSRRTMGVKGGVIHISPETFADLLIEQLDERDYLTVARRALATGHWQAKKSGAVVVASIVQAVAEADGISAEQILGPSRLAPIVHGRFCVYWVARNLTLPQLTFPQIGRRVKRDHTTVLYACRKVEAAWEQYRGTIFRAASILKIPLERDGSVIKGTNVGARCPSTQQGSQASPSMPG